MKNTLDANKFRISLDERTVLPQDLLLLTPSVSFTGLPEVRLQSGASWHDDNIIGRSEPYRSYLYSTGTSISFTGVLIATGGIVGKSKDIATAIAAGALGLTGRFIGQSAPFIGPAGKVFSLIRNGIPSAAEQEALENERIGTIWFEVAVQAAWLEALTKPQYDSMGWAYPPPHVWIQHGQNFLKRGLLTSSTITFKGPYEPNTLLSMHVEVEMTFVEDNEIPKSLTDVAGLKFPDRVAPGANEFTTQDAVPFRTVMTHG
jgi:hypothetical protein